MKKKLYKVVTHCGQMLRILSKMIESLILKWNIINCLVITIISIAVISFLLFLVYVNLNRHIRDMALICYVFGDM